MLCTCIGVQHQRGFIMIIPCGQGFPFSPDNSPDRDPRAREIIAYNRSEGSELADPPQETESQRIFCVCFHSV
jgi:hypothetical protein